MIDEFIERWIKSNPSTKVRARLVEDVQEHCETNRDDQHSPSQRLIYERINKLGFRSHFH